MRGRLGDEVSRFWSNVNKSDGCWLWTGPVSTGGLGYGVFTIYQRKHAAHRYSWTLHNGEIPQGLCVCHRCDVPLCVRPEHLFLGTQAENIADAIAKGRLNPKANHRRLSA